MNDEAITTTGKFVGSDEVHSSISPHLEESGDDGFFKVLI